MSSSIDDERQLLLGRASDTSAALATTRGSIAEKTGQKETLAAQLRMLKPVTQSPFVSSLVTTLGNVDHSERNVGGATPRPLDEPRLSDPPLLMVRVYQDAMVCQSERRTDGAGNSAAGAGGGAQATQRTVRRVILQGGRLFEVQARAGAGILKLRHFC